MTSPLEGERLESRWPFLITRMSRNKYIKPYLESLRLQVESLVSRDVNSTLFSALPLSIDEETRFRTERGLKTPGLSLL